MARILAGGGAVRVAMESRLAGVAGDTHGPGPQTRSGGSKGGSRRLASVLRSAVPSGNGTENAGEPPVSDLLDEDVGESATLENEVSFAISCSSPEVDLCLDFLSHRSCM